MKINIITRGWSAVQDDASNRRRGVINVWRLCLGCPFSLSPVETSRVHRGSDSKFIANPKEPVCKQHQRSFPQATYKCTEICQLLIFPAASQRVRSRPSNLWPCVFGMTLYKHEFQSLYAKQLARRTRAIINSHPPQPIKSRRRRPSYGLICIRMSLSRSFDNFQNWPIWIQPFLPSLLSTFRENSLFMDAQLPSLSPADTVVDLWEFQFPPRSTRR